MRKIFKYHLPPLDVQEIEMPMGAAVLTIQEQNGEPYIWAEVDPDAPMIKRRFRTFGTGHPMDGDNFPHYVGTYQMHAGALVFHVYTDRTERP